MRSNAALFHRSHQFSLLSTSHISLVLFVDSLLLFVCSGRLIGSFECRLHIPSAYSIAYTHHDLSDGVLHIIFPLKSSSLSHALHNPLDTSALKEALQRDDSLELTHDSETETEN